MTMKLDMFLFKGGGEQMRKYIFWVQYANISNMTVSLFSICSLSGFLPPSLPSSLPPCPPPLSFFRQSFSSQTWCGDSSVSKVFALQAAGPEFDPQDPC